MGPFHVFQMFWAKNGFYKSVPIKIQLEHTMVLSLQIC